MRLKNCNNCSSFIKIDGKHFTMLSYLMKYGLRLVRDISPLCSKIEFMAIA